MSSLVAPKQSWRNAALAGSMELISSFGSDDFSSLGSLVAEDVLYMTPRTRSHCAATNSLQAR